MDIYAHALAQEEVDAAEAIDKLLSPNLIQPERADAEASSAKEKPASTTPTVIAPFKQPPLDGPVNDHAAEAAIREFALAQKKEFTKRQAMEACHIVSQKWMSNALVHLQREGVIKKLGTSRDVRYKLCS